MEYRVQANYDREIIAEAARRYSWRSVRWSGLIAFVLVVLGLADMIASGDRSWLVGVLGALVVAAATVGVATFVVPYRRSLDKFERMPSRTAEFIFSEAGVSTSSDIGRSELSWKLIDRVWIYPRVWMIFLRGGTYMTLPAANLEEGTRAFIVDQVKQHGGRIG